MKAAQDFAAVFAGLRDVLKKHEPALAVQDDEDILYTLVTSKPDTTGNPMYFGCVRLGKAYVSYHLFPLYLFPDLLDDLPPGLKPRKQGKTCFNFRAVDAARFKELAALTKRCFQRFRKERLL